MGKRGPAPISLNELMFWESEWYWVFHLLRGELPSYEQKLVGEAVRKQLRAELAELEKSSPKDFTQKEWVPFRSGQIRWQLTRRKPLSEPEVWRQLVQAQTAEQVRKACEESKRWLNPKAGRPYVQLLHDKAEQFVRAKKYAYYPRRASGDVKRIAFFARVMAGITLGISPITAVDRLRKMKHGRGCPCVNCHREQWDKLYLAFYKDLLVSSKKRIRRKGAKR